MFFSVEDRSRFYAYSFDRAAFISPKSFALSTKLLNPTYSYEASEIEGCSGSAEVRASRSFCPENGLGPGSASKVHSFLPNAGINYETVFRF